LKKDLLSKNLLNPSQKRSSKEESIPAIKPVEPVKTQTVEEKFIARKKIFVKEIPVTGDSIELNFMTMRK